MSPIRQMTYQAADAASGGVEVMTFARLRDVNHGGTQRADFHVLALVEGGRGSVSVDFASFALVERSAVWIVPGAVHRWRELGDLAGRLVLFVPTAPVTPATRARVAERDLEPTWRIPDDEWPYVVAAERHLRMEASAAPAAGTGDLPEILLSALVARLRPPRHHGGEEDTTFRLFRSSVEAHFRVRHDAGSYARELGYAPRTLSRAVQRMTGRTAKAFITDRVVLEAQRLLAHDGFTAARCASELGFRDASHFSVVFRRATGLPPGAWQRTWSSR